MPLLNDSDREQLRQEFARLQDPVKLVLFTQAADCEYCELTQQLLEQVAELSDKIKVQVHDFANDPANVSKYQIARVPAIAVVRVESEMVGGIAQVHDHDYGIRFYGVPAGYEFAALLGDIFDVSRGESGLDEQSKTMLAQLKEPLHLQVFSTPT
ncbi:MAG TPA: thioredoxin family protein [Anaerolineae bacterium]